MTARAAHFLLVPELAFSPPNEAIVNSLLEHGLEVDLYAPGGRFDVSAYGPRVSAHAAEYGYRWLANNLLNAHWRQYSVLSGTSENPLAIVGALAALYHRRSFGLIDEIRSGSYSGNRSARWKALCRHGMRHADLCIVNDPARIALLQDYAGIGDAGKIIVYPGCFRNPPEPAGRPALRTRWAIPGDAFVLCCSGHFGAALGAEWLLAALDEVPELYVVVQPVNLDPFLRTLLGSLKHSERIFVEPRRLGWREAWSTMGGIDAGMSIYLDQGPQFQAMGISSNRLCMALAMGVPVITDAQESFSFVDEFGCGVRVRDTEGFVRGVRTIMADLTQMKANARRCAEEHIRPAARYEELSARIGALLA